MKKEIVEEIKVGLLWQPSLLAQPAASLLAAVKLILEAKFCYCKLIFPQQFLEIYVDRVVTGMAGSS